MEGHQEDAVVLLLLCVLLPVVVMANRDLERLPSLSGTANSQRYYLSRGIPVDLKQIWFTVWKDALLSSAPVGVIQSLG